MRMFVLHRVIDHTGISGTGIVAEGVQFTDGTVALRWLDNSIERKSALRGVTATTVLHDDIDSVEALHGHGGATQVHWLDEMEDK